MTIGNRMIITFIFLMKINSIISFMYESANIFSTKNRKSILHSQFMMETTTNSLYKGSLFVSNEMELMSTTLLNSQLYVNKESKYLLSLSLKFLNDNDESPYTIKLFQSTDGPVPRSYLPSLLIFEGKVDKEMDNDIQTVLEEAMKWYLDRGGRLSSIKISSLSKNLGLLESMGFESSSGIETSSEMENILNYKPAEHVLFMCNPIKFKSHCENRILNGDGDKHTLYDIIGRVMHDMGNPKDAIKVYTQALQLNPNSAATFRNLGSAYHAVGDMQLAFASYQQTIQLDPNGFYYLFYNFN